MTDARLITPKAELRWHLLQWRRELRKAWPWLYIPPDPKWWRRRGDRRVDYLCPCQRKPIGFYKPLDLYEHVFKVTRLEVGVFRIPGRKMGRRRHKFHEVVVWAGVCPDCRRAVWSLSYEARVFYPDHPWEGVIREPVRTA